MGDDPFSAIKDAALRGNKIEAIKLYREHNRVGLAEAKEAVDHLVQELRERPGNPAQAVFQPADHRPLSGSRLAAIQAALYGGNKIEAIKLYRELNPVGLAEAKSIIDALEAGLRAQTPGLFTRPSSATGPGCVVFLIVLVALGCGVWRMMH